MFCRPEDVKNPAPCPHCGDVVGGEMGHTTLDAAYTPQARALLRMYGHLVVLAGKRWLLMCNGDPKSTHLWSDQVVAGKLAPTVAVARAVAGGANGKAPQGGRRG